MSPITSRRTLDDIIRFTSSIGENSVFTGNLTTVDNVVVRGTIIGDSSIDGIIVIEAQGCWQGNISANTLIINGQVEGNVIASDKIELQKNANIIGDLTCPKIAIATGAIHHGKIHMHSKTKITTFDEKRKSVSSTE